MSFTFHHIALIIQTLDQTMFQNLKRNCKTKFRRNMIGASKGRSTSLDVINNIEEATKSITKATIVDSWRNCGIIPWDKQLILTRAKEMNGKVASVTAFDAVRDMFIAIINDIMGSTDTDSFPIPTASDKLYLPEEFIEEMKKLKDQQMQKKETLSKKRKLMDNNSTSRKIQNNEEPENIRCCFGQHNTIESPDITSTTKWVTCNKQCGFKVCSKCFNYMPEYLIYHEEVCDELFKAMKKKKQRIT